MYQIYFYKDYKILFIMIDFKYDLLNTNFGTFYLYCNFKVDI